MAKKKERGAAEIKITLSDGKIEVVHGEDGATLFKGNAYEGYWDKLWEAIQNPDYVKTKYRVVG